MKKYFVSFLLLLVAPSICFGSSARYTQLVREKQRKMEQLEKCMGSNKKLQIAGISTLGLTAIGVAGNIAEAKMIKDNTKKIASQEETIEDKKIELAQKQQDKAEADAAAAAAPKEYNDRHTLEIIVNDDIRTISASGGNIGDKAISHGYQPEQLPSGLRNSFGNAMGDFIKNCFALQGTKNIKTVSAGAKSESEWRAFSGVGTLKESDVLQNNAPYEIAECKAETCDDHYYPTEAGCVPEERQEGDDQDSEKNTTTVVSDTKVSATGGAGSVVASQTVSAEQETPAHVSGTDVNGGSEPGDKTEVVTTQETPADTEKKTEQKTATTPKKCSEKTLNAVNAKDGVIEGKKCKVTSCKGNLVKSDDELSCKCPSDKPKLDKKTMMCSAEKPATTVVEEKKTTADVSTWTDAYKHEHAKEYCDAKYKNQPNIHACCMEVHDTQKAFNWQKGKCVCKNSLIWDGKNCITLETLKNWDSQKKRDNADIYCTNRYNGQWSKDRDEQACCFEIFQYQQATGWDGNKCLCKDNMHWSARKCIVNKEKVDCVAPTKWFRSGTAMYKGKEYKASIPDSEANPQNNIANRDKLEMKLLTQIRKDGHENIEVKCTYK